MAYTTALSTLTLPEMTDLIKYNFVENKDKVKPVARQLFILDPVGLGKGDSKSYLEFDGDTFASRKDEGVNAAKAKKGTGYSKVAKAVRFAKEINISWEIRSLAKDMDIKREIVSLVDFIPQREELDLTHRITFGTSTSYTDMDGQTVDVSMGDGFALFYASHTLAGSSTTYSNRVSGDPLFSQGALESALGLSVTDTYSNLGEIRVLDFNVIYSGRDPATVAEIKRVLKSTSDTTQDNSGVINAYMGAMTHVVLPYLNTTSVGTYDSTKAKWWGIVAPGSWNAYLGMYEEENLKTPTSGNNGEDVHNDDWTYGVRQMRSICVVSGRGIIGSCPAS